MDSGGTVQAWIKADPVFAEALLREQNLPGAFRQYNELYDFVRLLHNIAKKGTKEIRPYSPPSATLRVPCVARQAGLLRNSRFALRQSSQKSPGLAALLGGGSRGPKINATTSPS